MEYGRYFASVIDFLRYEDIVISRWDALDRLYRRFARVGFKFSCWVLEVPGHYWHCKYRFWAEGEKRYIYEPA